MTDRVRESLFSSILAWIPESTVLDLYAGTGSMGLEALSRGGGESVLAHVAESLRLTVVRVLPGDRVSVELGPRDTGRGRIVSKVSK